MLEDQFRALVDADPAASDRPRRPLLDLERRDSAADREIREDPRRVAGWSSRLAAVVVQAWLPPLGRGRVRGGRCCTPTSAGKTRRRRRRSDRRSLAGSRRAEPLPGVRAPGGRDSQPERSPFADRRTHWVALVAEVLRSAIQAALEKGSGYVHALIKKVPGGAVSPACHSQLVWMREEPPAVSGENGTAGRGCSRGTS